MEKSHQPAVEHRNGPSCTSNQNQFAATGPLVVELKQYDETAVRLIFTIVTHKKTPIPV